jgi:hypothetical protein
MKQKSIDFYVQDVPLMADEAQKLRTLTAALPKGLPYGVRTRVWSTFFPHVAFMGEMVAYTTIDEQGQSTVTFFAYDDFVMADVPWEDIIA